MIALNIISFNQLKKHLEVQICTREDNTQSYSNA